MRFCRRFDEALRGNTGMNSKFDERYEIRPAAAKDIGQIMTFIGTFWKKGHILAVNRSFFEYEFLEADGSVNFLLAIDREKGSVEGILGYLKASHDAECMDIWGSIWKVKEGNTPLLGLELALRMEELIPFRYRLGIGSNPKTSIPFMKLFPGRKVSKMKHFYRLCRKEDFQIADIAYFPETSAAGGCENKISVDVHMINNWESDKTYSSVFNKKSVPYKDKDYYKKRFFEHHIYQYLVYGISSEGKERALVVFREETVGERKALRIVDYTGDQGYFGCLGSFLDSIEEQYEYIDFYCLGFDERYIYEAGFALRRDDDENIIPNYFHPFEQRNVDIWVHYPADGTLFCKADGDQDRPNG